MQPRSRIRSGARTTAFVAVAALSLHLPAAAAPPAGTAKAYQAEYLVSDGSLPTENQDAELKNGWGLAASPTGPWWIAVNEMSLAKVYGGDGMLQDLRVTIPAPPTGVVAYQGTGFVVTDGSSSGPARFLFATESGTIAAWSPQVGPAAPNGQAFTVVDRSLSGAIYTGLTIGTTSSGDRLYAADFHDGRVDVFDSSFASVATSGGFVDPKLPAGYAPFGIQNLSGRIFVSYAQQDATATDEVAGQGLGIVDVFDTDGNLIGRVAAHGQLNAPWGMAIAPAGFGSFSGKLLVGNFGDGEIVAFTLTDDLQKSVPSGVLRDPSGKPIAIDGLWGIAFGNDAEAGPANALYFAAGPSGETHGAFGRIVLASTP